MSNFQSYKCKKFSKQKNKKKIILNTAQDLLKIPQEEFEKINISNLSGVYYDQLYKEAIRIEGNSVKLRNKRIIKSKDSKFKSPNRVVNDNNKSKGSPATKSLIRRNFKEKVNVEKSRSKSKEKNRILKKHDYSIFANHFSVDLRNNKHLFSPEIPPKMNNPFTSNNEVKKPKNLKHNKNNNNNKIVGNNINRKRNSNVIADDDKFDNNSYSDSRKIGINLISTFDKMKVNERKKLYISMIKKAQNGNNPEYNFNYNKINNDEVYNKQQSNQNNKTVNNNYNNIINDNNTNNNTNNYINNNNVINNDTNTNTNTIRKVKYTGEFKIDKIIFYIRYDSNYGDNIGILGSIEKLGNWSQDKILYLKWNKGNIWTGEIDVDDSIFPNFEFKFINRHDGIIYWEKGLNNVVDLNELIQELKYQKKGRYNKYEYKYDNNNFTLILTCKIKGWE